MLTLKNNEFDSYQFLGSGTTRNSGQYLSNNRCGLKNAFRNMQWSSNAGGASQQRCYLGGFAANQGQAECWTKDRGGGSCSGAPQLDRFGDDVYSNYPCTEIAALNNGGGETRFQSTMRGDGCDNPEFPNLYNPSIPATSKVIDSEGEDLGYMMNKVQMARALRLTFTDTNTMAMKYGIYTTKQNANINANLVLTSGSGAGACPRRDMTGRNFLFAGIKSLAACDINALFGEGGSLTGRRMESDA